MRVLNVGNLDLGGDGIRTKRAFDRHAPSWTYNAVVRGSKFFAYPPDRPWSEAATLARSADVVHARNSFRAARMAGGLDKPLVITHHGTRFRNRPVDILDEQRRHGALGLAATLDLWLLAPDELEWLPAPYDLDWLASMRTVRPSDGPLRIGHAPTNRAIKSTDAFLAACRKLGRETPVEVVLIEGQSWERCLQLKATCDIHFDQVILGYGNNAIESWGLGCPVIAGADDPAVLEEMQDRFGSLPFYATDEGKIYDSLAALAEPDARAHWSRRGLDHVNQWHDDAKVVDQIQRVYRRAVER